MFKQLLLNLLKGATQVAITEILDEYKLQEGDVQFAADQQALETIFKKLDAIAKAKGKKFIDGLLTTIETGIENA